ncbi:MAG: ArsR/SmtB family transcription factor [Halodesulfurarchaeum sp.]
MSRRAGETKDQAEYGELQSCPTLVTGEETLHDIESRLDSTQYDRELALLSVVADDTKYRILRLLHESGERCVCEFDPVLDVSNSAISHALSRLVEADLVQRRKEGRWRVYSTTDRADQLLDAVSTVVAE